MDVPSPSPVLSPRLRRFRISPAIIVGLILLVLIASGAAYFLWQKKEGGLPPGHVIFAPTAAPAFPVTMYEPGTGRVEPLVVEGQGTASLVGYAPGDEYSYYLVSENGGSQSNVYERDTKNPARGLRQITSSDSLKLGLSYSPETGQLAYARMQNGTTSMITVANAGTTTERTLVPGTNPIFLKGGFFIVYEDKGTLYSLNLSSGMSYKLLDLPMKGAYAVDGEGLKVVIYQPATTAYDFYTVAGMTAASYEHSVSATAATSSRIIAVAGKEIVEGIAGPRDLELRFNGSKPYTAANALRYSAGRMIYIPQ